MPGLPGRHFSKDERHLLDELPGCLTSLGRSDAATRMRSRARHGSDRPLLTSTSANQRLHEDSPSLQALTLFQREKLIRAGAQAGTGMGWRARNGAMASATPRGSLSCSAWFAPASTNGSVCGSHSRSRS